MHMLSFSTSLLSSQRCSRCLNITIKPLLQRKISALIFQTHYILNFQEKGSRRITWNHSMLDYCRLYKISRIEPDKTETWSLQEIVPVFHSPFQIKPGQSWSSIGTYSSSTSLN